MELKVDILGMSKIWKIKPAMPREIVEKIGRILSENPHPSAPGGHPLPEGEGNLKLLSQLLYNRGLTEKNQITEFLEPKYENLHDPFSFRDMQKAVDRIWRAIDQKEKICIYGDYDADAVTANAVLQQTFRHLGVEVESYIPDRFTEGYGINIEALEKIRDAGSTLIITVDCGTNSVDAAEFCSANSIDLIITDHHELIGELPKAYALINPKNPDDNYPYSEITGVGVAFRLACAILSSAKGLGLRAKVVDGWEKWLLDLVAIGTVADCHSLLGENRILVKYGLKVLQKTRWMGLRALIASSDLDFKQKPPDTYTLGFIIAPRLNAAGRLEHANIALDLLLEQNQPAAAEKALQLENINLRRQEQTARIMSEAKEQALMHQDRKIFVLAGEGWNKGVVGLVAGRLAEEFYKPVIVLEKSTDFSTGSARTVGEFDILEAIKFSSEHTVRFGGHKQAAGLTIKTGEIEFFYRKILEFAEKNIGDENQRTLELEAELSPSDLSLDSCLLLSKLEPFGVDNPKPKFLVNQMKIISLKAVGTAQNHTQLNLQKGSVNIPAIIFNSNLLEKNFKVGDTVDVACELMEDGWNGRKGIKLKIVDIKKIEN